MMFFSWIFKSKVIITQPRIPCYKIGFRFGRLDIIKKFLASGCPGIYLRVYRRKEKLSCKFNKHLINRDHNLVTVSEIIRLYINDTEDIKTMRRAFKVDVLPEDGYVIFLSK